MYYHSPYFLNVMNYRSPYFNNSLCCLNVMYFHSPYFPNVMYYHSSYFLNVMYYHSPYFLNVIYYRLPYLINNCIYSHPTSKTGNLLTFLHTCRNKLVLSFTLQYGYDHNSYFISFNHCVVCSSSIYVSDYPFGIFKLFFLNSN